MLDEDEDDEQLEEDLALLWLVVLSLLLVIFALIAYALREETG